MLAPNPPDTSLLRFRVVYAGQPLPVTPAADSDLTLTRAPGSEGAFYYRDTLSGGPFTFAGADFALLSAINRSTARCQVLGLQVQHRGAPDLPWETWTGSFTCNDCQEWNETTCTVKLTPASADPYAKLLNAWEKPYNILLTPGVRQTVTAELVELAAGISLEFKRVGLDEEADYLGTDGWVLFLQNRSWIPEDNFYGVRETNDILFRYRLRDVEMVPNGQGGYTPPDKSSTGWQLLAETFDPVGGTVDYVKEPAIAGFKPYKIGTYSNWNDPRNPERVPLYGDQLLLIDSSKSPADYGYQNSDYLDVTGPDGGWPLPRNGGGANNAECGGQFLRVRRSKNDDQCSKLLWRFGSFRFGRCFPLRDGLHNVLLQTMAPTGDTSLVPPTPEQLGEFLAAGTIVNQATGDTGAANELPGLLLSAGSDVKRYGSSEAATRLLISLKELLTDMGNAWDGGWLVDPLTGYLRFESRAWFEARQGAATVDLPSLEDALLSNAYSFRVQQLPRYETLRIANAQTEQVKAGLYFAEASLDYGLGGCVNQREGQNRSTFDITRLTGDVTAGVLYGDSLPDTCLFVLAPDGTGRLLGANRQLSASELLRRYYTRGRAAAVASLEGPAPVAAPNSVTHDPPPAGPPATILSVRPAREQVSPRSGKLPSLALLDPAAHYVTNLAANGQLGKAVLNLRTRALQTTVWLPGLGELTAPPVLASRQFDDSFDLSFG